MKFIIIGLGNFGSALARKLTLMGHEVIGVDKSMAKVEDIKDYVTHSVCLDCMHQTAIESLPFKNTDVVVVSIGENEGANLIVTALVKKMGIPKLICRAISPVHSTILDAMEVTEIVRPEQESATRLAMKLTSDNVIESVELSEDYSLVQAVVPKRFVGKSVGEIGFNRNYKVLVLSVKRKQKEKGIFNNFKKTKFLGIEGVANSNTVLNEGDILILYGSNDDIFTVIN
jgi:trk system potassium uptake protein TrkA